MWPDEIQRPSEQLDDLLRGRIAWDDAPASIQSWAQLTIHHAARAICDAPDKGTRRNMLGRIPASVRPQVELRVKALWADMLDKMECEK